MKGDFQICISAPLSYAYNSFIFCLFLAFLHFLTFIFVV